MRVVSYLEMAAYMKVCKIIRNKNSKNVSNNILFVKIMLFVCLFVDLLREINFAIVYICLFTIFIFHENSTIHYILE